MTRLDDIVIPLKVDDQDVQRELRRRDRAQRREGKRPRAKGARSTKGAKGSLTKGGVIGAVAGAVVGLLGGNDAVSSMGELLLNIVAAVLLPLMVAMLPLFEALAPLVETLLKDLIPAMLGLAEGVKSWYDRTVGKAKDILEDASKYAQENPEQLQAAQDAAQVVSGKKVPSDAIGIINPYEKQKQRGNRGILNYITDRLDPYLPDAPSIGFPTSNSAFRGYYS